MSTDLSYEATARYYDSAYAPLASLRDRGPDVEFYRRLASASGGPVLELGCGTGRTLLPIAQQGIACAGVDASPAMLEQFRRKPGSDRVALTCARMESFDLGDRRFGLIFAAFRGFQHLDTTGAQLACLARVRAHLAPGGVFAFDVFNPQPQRMVIEHEPESLDVAFECEGRTVQRFAEVTRDLFHQIAHVTFRYVEAPSANQSRETVVKFTMRWFWRYELEHLLHRAGFKNLTLFGDFDHSPVSAQSPALIVVAR